MRTAGLAQTLLLAAGLFAAAQSAAASDAFRTIGRSTPLENDGVAFVWPGTTLETVFEGSNLTVTLKDNGNTWLNVDVDGSVETIRLQRGTNDYKIVDNDPGRHTVRLVRRTGVFSGRTELVGYESDGTLKATPDNPRKMLVLGDSIASGHGVDGPDQHCRFSFETENQTAAYAALTADAFDADLHTIAVGGRGLVRNYGGDRTKVLGDFFAWTMADGNEAWDRSRYRPDLVIVHVGANDFYTNDPETGFPAEFEAAYLDLLSGLRKDYPDAWIYAAYGPLKVSDTSIGTVKDAVDKLAKDGDDKIRFMKFDSAKSGRIFGCDWHPGADTHKAIAAGLVKQIERDLGWAAGG